MSYTGLVAGDYVVSEEFAPAGWQLTAITCDDGASDNPSTGDLQNAAVRVGVEPGESVTCIFTNSLVDGAVIGDLVWMDTVADGMQGDPTLELGVPGVQVRLYEAGANSWTSARRTRPDTTGSSRWCPERTNLRSVTLLLTRSGRWSTLAAMPAAIVMPRCRLSLGDDQSRFSALFTVAAGQEDLSWDAGLATVAGAATATVGDYVWLDSNKNGIQDSEESGVPGCGTSTLQTDTRRCDNS